jgi:hypothetical protein
VREFSSAQARSAISEASQQLAVGDLLAIVNRSLEANVNADTHRSLPRSTRGTESQLLIG